MSMDREFRGVISDMVFFSFGDERRVYDNHAFYGCMFRGLRGLTLKNCVLTNCNIDPKTVADCLGVTATLDCGTFEGLEMNELAFDAMLMLLTRTKGNDKKRQALVDLVGRRKAREILTELGRGEYSAPEGK